MKKLENKKILYLVTQTKWGGAQKYVLELAEYFSQNNEVHIAFGEINEQNQEFLAQCQKIGVKTIPIKNLVRNIQPSKEINAFLELKKLLDSGKYHLAHLNSSKAGLIGSIAASIHNLNPLNTRLRLIYTAHGFVFNEPLNKIEKTIYKMSEKFSTAVENAIITVSDYDKQSAIEHKICPAHKMFTIHNGLDFNKYNFLSAEDAKKELNLDENKTYFGTIASFYKTKGHTYLLEAIKIFLETQNREAYHWILIGDGPEQKNIEELIKKYNLEKYITIISPKNNDWKYLKAFDYFILPSVKEGLPYTLLEAGLAKIPVIATQVGGVPEIITDHQTGLLVTPANPLSLANAMKEITETELVNNFIENNYQNIIDNFDLNQTIQKTEELYLKLF
ncbi:MAG: Glycosyl transferase group 1 [Parcubacteria group bacterium GW2011_GWA2_36_10]|nr:MAG: Glycosyl transferase group 1 [Parcubacteria group bacterium GW2011_GWA2_36_10]